MVSQAEENSDKPERIKDATTAKPGDKTLEDYGRSWQNLNHSVMLIGWGYDPAK